MLILLLSTISYAVENIGSSEVVNGSAQTKTQSPAVGFTFEGGNISEVNISHTTQSSLWQGVYGSISAFFVLQDASGNTFYNWSLSNITSGEVYFTRYNAIDFGNIVDPTTSFVSFVQSTLGIANTTYADNLTQTFTDGSHSAFAVGSTSIASPTPRVLTYNSTGAGIFETIFLREGGFNRDAYASLINADKTGFNGKVVDFQALLPMNASEIVSTYYVYAEIQ